MTETPSATPRFHEYVCDSAPFNATYHEMTTWFFQHILSSIINWLLELEITAFLNTASIDTHNGRQGHMRNGYYKRRLETRYGTLSVKIPRDRNGSFKQQTVPFYCRSTFAVENLILSLINRDMSQNEQLHLLHKHYETVYPPYMLSYMTHMAQQDIDQFYNKPITLLHSVLFFGYLPLYAMPTHHMQSACYFVLNFSKLKKATLLDCRCTACNNNNIWTQISEILKQYDLNKVEYIFANESICCVLQSLFPEHSCIPF